MIVTIGLVILPVLTPEPNEDGTVKFIINVSSPSTMLSLVTGTFTVILLLPPVIIIGCEVELKSMSLPIATFKNKNK